MTINAHSHKGITMYDANLALQAAADYHMETLEDMAIEYAEWAGMDDDDYDPSCEDDPYGWDETAYDYWE